MKTAAGPIYCRCGTQIIFMYDTKGTRQVLDARRHPIYQPVVGEPGSGICERVEDARLSHFVTCRQRTRFKRLDDRAKVRRKALKELEAQHHEHRPA